MLIGLLTFFHVIACFTLILVILLQVGRGHGLSGASFSQGGVQTVFGTKAADFLSKVTSVMAIIFVITCISLDIVYSRQSRSLFAPGAAGGQVDMEKLKQALEALKLEETQKAGGEKGVPAGTEAPAPGEKTAAGPAVPGPAVQTAPPAAVPESGETVPAPAVPAEAGGTREDASEKPAEPQPAAQPAS